MIQVPRIPSNITKPKCHSMPPIILPPIEIPACSIHHNNTYIQPTGRAQSTSPQYLAISKPHKQARTGHPPSHPPRTTRPTTPPTTHLITASPPPSDPPHPALTPARRPLHHLYLPTTYRHRHTHIHTQHRRLAGRHSRHQPRHTVRNGPYLVRRQKQQLAQS